MPWNAPFTCMGSSQVTCQPQRLPLLSNVTVFADKLFLCWSTLRMAKRLVSPPPLNNYYGRIILIIILIQLEHVFLQYRVVEGWRMLANPEVSVALDSLDKKPTGFAIGLL